MKLKISLKYEATTVIHDDGPGYPASKKNEILAFGSTEYEINESGDFVKTLSNSDAKLPYKSNLDGAIAVFYYLDELCVDMRDSGLDRRYATIVGMSEGGYTAQKITLSVDSKEYTFYPRGHYESLFEVLVEINKQVPSFVACRKSAIAEINAQHMATVKANATELDSTPYTEDTADLDSTPSTDEQSAETEQPATPKSLLWLKPALSLGVLALAVGATVVATKKMHGLKHTP